MLDMTKTTAPKSDQMNADDLIGGKTITIKITKVSLLAGEQPIAISYEGDNGKPYKPGKSMRRVMVTVWGSDGNQYIGRSLTLYRDDKVLFGGVAVGGLRISHMSHIDKEITMALTASKANRKPFTVKPLVVKPESELLKQAKDKALGGTQSFNTFLATLTEEQKAEIRPYGKELMATAKDADDAEKGEAVND